ncbi:threonine-phosphate decarboxylase [Thalassococcus sp. S3]|uniref:threonine-phosphate decarboxylase n=1 Tax=Thalassococcus sp. S3 TaxID=2017482 RepID=UPI0010245B2C|nr:threonine-phosphate decarboxylase [Thalassococcus sp. S3]QBF29988.1 threonine-phosphate decarboxylase [Thalassococcus sp. S3]
MAPIIAQSRARDHGGGLDAAVSHYGGARRDWIDLSTGINPVPYPLPTFTAGDWRDLPDQAAQTHLLSAARHFWRVPDRADILAAPGLSAVIAKIPALRAPGHVRITPPTYNEHEAAFTAAGWQVDDTPAPVRVLVHPNNPDGRLWQPADLAPELTIIDESFCDVLPEKSLIAAAENHLVLKSFGKFWGLAGLRLGFAVGPPALIAALAEMLGPWPVSGPALRTGATALEDPDWAASTRARLVQDANRLDTAMTAKGAQVAGGTTLFRLYQVDDAAAWQERLARRQIWSRIFPYSQTLLRLGLPHPDAFPRVEAALL